MRKTLTIAVKTLLEAWRDRQLIIVYLAFPALMVLVYYVGFGQSTSMASFITVVVENRDRGALGAEFVQALHAAMFDGQPVFTIQENIPPQQGEISLEEGKAAALLTIPPDFSAALERKQPTPAEISLLGDPLTDTYVFTFSFLNEVSRTFIDAKINWQQPLPVSLEFLPNTGKLTDFQFGVPGMMVFGLTFGLIVTALVLVREETSGTLQRIRLSKASGAQMMGGVAIANLALGVVQAPLAFVTALACGFRSPGSLPLALGITLIFNLGMAGVGFLVACFSRSEGAANGIGTVVMVVYVFLSGAVFPMPTTPLFYLGGHMVQLYDILPSMHAGEALRRVLIYGDGIPSIAYELTLLVIQSLLLLALGAWLYQRKMLKSQY